MDLKKELGSVSGACDCYCKRTSDEPTISCSNPECPISVFHLACLSTTVPKTWLGLHCIKCHNEGCSSGSTSFHDDSDIVYLGTRTECWCWQIWGKCYIICTSLWFNSISYWIARKYYYINCSSTFTISLVYPALQGFQWTNLGVYLNFDKVDGDVIQI